MSKKLEKLEELLEDVMQIEKISKKYLTAGI